MSNIQYISSHSTLEHLLPLVRPLLLLNSGCLQLFPGGSVYVVTLIFLKTWHVNCCFDLAREAQKNAPKKTWGCILLQTRPLQAMPEHSLKGTAPTNRLGLPAPDGAASMEMAGGRKGRKRPSIGSRISPPLEMADLTDDRGSTEAIGKRQVGGLWVVASVIHHLLLSLQDISSAGVVFI